MDIKPLFDENEKPLDNLQVINGGYTAVFRTIACVGDSLSSGEFESLNSEGQKRYHDMFEYSWGQYIARAAGCKVYNFSRGGMTAAAYIDSFAQENGFWDKDKASQAYIIALGVNDLFGRKMPVGCVDDIAENYKANKQTFAGYYGAIVQRLKEISPDAKFFFMTIPKSDREEALEKEADKHAELLHSLTERFENSYVIDLRKYAPVYDAEFKKQFFLGGHMSPAGYILTAQMVMSYIDYIVRHNMRDFKQVGFIGTPFKNPNA